MAFLNPAYGTGEESLRDIEACLLAQTAKYYHMGFREPVAQSTLADANEARDWRIWAAFAGRLIAQGRALYASEDGRLDLSNTEGEKGTFWFYDLSGGGCVRVPAPLRTSYRLAVFTRAAL